MVKYLLNNGGKDIIEEPSGYMPFDFGTMLGSTSTKTQDGATVCPLNVDGSMTGIQSSNTIAYGRNRIPPETPLQAAASTGCLTIVKLIVEQGGAVTHRDELKVPNGSDGDLTAGYLQSHGSKPVTRF
jgi:hypothetical protein